MVLFLLLFLNQENKKAEAGGGREDERKKALAGRREPWFIRLSRRLLTGQTRRDLLRVCYGKYGCFSVDWPWFNTYRVLNLIPKNPKAIRPKFHLYTRFGKLFCLQSKIDQV